MLKHYSFVVSFILACFLMTGCGAGTPGTECTANITEDEKFGAAEIDISQEEFFELGFKLGDSVDLTFSNGFALKDIPFFNGYYVKTGQPVLVAYPGFEKVSVTYNNQGIWSQENFNQGDSVTITVNTVGKYSTTQEALGQDYSADRSKYSNDIEFANFRSLSGGNLKENYFYRGASPVNNSRGRAKFVDNLLKENNINFVIDLADSADNIEEFISGDGFDSSYAKNLYQENKIALLGMGSSYSSEKYKKSVAEGLRMMMKNEGPVYIHCLEGKDRTGFVCMLIEAFAGAGYDEMLRDYMITYDNYYNISLDDTPEKYNAVAELYFNAFMEYLHGTDDINVLRNADYSEDAKAYLKDAGMDDKELEELYSILTK